MKPHPLLAACVALACASVPAAAQTTVDLTPVTNSLIGILATVLTGIATWAGWYLKNLLASKVGIANSQLADQLQQRYNEIAKRGIAYAETIFKGVVPTKLNVNNEFVAVAAKYVVEYWPELVAQVGLTPEKVRDTIIARLPSGEQTKQADAIVMAKAGAVAPVPEAKK